MATITRADLDRADALDGYRPVLIVGREYEATLGMVGVLGLGQHAPTRSTSNTATSPACSSSPTTPRRAEP